MPLDAGKVEIVNFPDTAVAAGSSTRGLSATVYESTRKLIEWRCANRVPPDSAATYGVHHDPRTHAETGYRIDICIGLRPSCRAPAAGAWWRS